MKTFEVILFFGKPAAGKSEVIDYLKKVPPEERIRKYYVGEFSVLDDFILIWKKGEEDDILEELGRKRLYTKRHPTGYLVTRRFLYRVLTKELSAAYKKMEVEKDKTVFIEFARGGTDAYRASLALLDEGILQKAAILHIKCSYKEVMRKNLRRYKPGEKESILNHSVPERVMRRYKTDDWKKLTREDPEFITIKDIKIPYADLVNEPEITDKPEVLGNELEKVLTRLKISYEKTH
ncbi:MAG: hypothetical protein AB1633_04880 [Elusimicrobiota bacterium]